MGATGSQPTSSTIGELNRQKQTSPPPAAPRGSPTTTSAGARCSPLPQPAGPTSIRLLALNTYLLPQAFVTKANATCTNQNHRANNIGRLIVGTLGRGKGNGNSNSDRRRGDDSNSARITPPPSPSTSAPPNAYDLIALQEMWGSSMKIIEDKITPHGIRIIPYCNSFYGWTAVDTAMQYINRRGGLWVGYRDARANHVGSKWHTFSISNTKSKKGVVASRFTLSELGLQQGLDSGSVSGEEFMNSVRQTPQFPDVGSGSTADQRREDRRAGDTPAAPTTTPTPITSGPTQLRPLSVILINTHLDPTNDNRMIEKQCFELQEWICKEIAQDRDFCPDPKATALLLVGDFNAPSPFITRQFTNMQTLDLYDDYWSSSRCPSGLAFQEGEHPRDRASYDGTLNSLVMWKSERARIDLQLAIKSVTLPHSSAVVEFANVQATAAEILYQPHGHEVSDHYPVELNLTISAV